MLETEVDELGWDVESKGYPWAYNPDGSRKTKEEEQAYMNAELQSEVEDYDN